jgi:histidine triad (HIT) family protein
MDCIFCTIAAGQLGTKFVYQDPAVVAFRDLNPQAPVHVLIIPRRHVARVSDVKAEDLNIFVDIHRAAQIIADQEKISSGFRLITNNGPDAGQTVDHLHYHLLAGRHMKWPPG